jgi:hypothetical protein
VDAKASLAALLKILFERGLGELPMLRVVDDHALIGNLVMEKGALTFKDRGLLTGVTKAAVAPCWDIGILGAVCDLRGHDWDSLTYLGPDNCHIPVNLSNTRHRLLRTIVNAAGEDLITYKGSAYRGFKMLLDSHLLPVLIPRMIETREKVPGVAVTDFRYAAVPLNVVLKVNDMARSAIERHVSLTVEDFEMSEDEFSSLFAGYIKE